MVLDYVAMPFYIVRQYTTLSYGEPYLPGRELVYTQQAGQTREGRGSRGGSYSWMKFGRRLK